MILKVTVASLVLPSRVFTVSAEHNFNFYGFYSPLRVHVLAQCRSLLKIYKIHGSLERELVKRRKSLKQVAEKLKTNMQHISFFFLSVFIFFFCSSSSLLFLPHFSRTFWLSSCRQSVRPPDGLIQTARGAHGSGGVAVAAVGLHALALGV